VRTHRKQSCDNRTIFSYAIDALQSAALLDHIETGVAVSWLPTTTIVLTGTLIP